MKKLKIHFFNFRRYRRADTTPVFLNVCDGDELSSSRQNIENAGSRTTETSFQQESQTITTTTEGANNRISKKNSKSRKNKFRKNSTKIDQSISTHVRTDFFNSSPPTVSQTQPKIADAKMNNAGPTPSFVFLCGHIFVAMLLKFELKSFEIKKVEWEGDFIKLETIKS